MTALKIHVERIVRPIIASARRKNRMRDELLAHLVAGFNDERKETESNEEAVGNVIERLGGVEAVRRDLQSTVPRLERISCIRVLPGMDDVLRNEKPPAESVWHYAARGATYIVGFLTPIVVLVAVGCAVEEVSEGTAWQKALIHFFEQLPFVIGVLPCVGIAFFVSFALFELTGMRARCSPASGTPTITKACLDTAFWLFSVVLLFGILLPLFNVFIPDNGGPSLTETIMNDAATVPLYVWILAAAFFMFATVPSLAFERRQYVEWTHLDLEQ